MGSPAPSASLHGKRILLGVTGSIAAYKSAVLARELQRRGATVRVVMTPGAIDFITPLTLATLTDHPVYSDFTENKDSGEWTNHVELGLWGDVFLVAPATANTLSAFVQGSCDNFLQAVHLSSRCPICVAPAMDLDMFAHGATQSNLARLAERGVGIIEPESGLLASGLEGKGRMLEPEAIADWLELWFHDRAPLKGQKILLTAGPTQEPIDSVRFIGNHSSGKMGYALATALVQHGAEVHLISGPVQLKVPAGVASVTNVQTAQEMMAAASENFNTYDIAIATAAVADARPKHSAAAKLHRNELPSAIALEPTPDILAHWGQQKAAHQTVIGFALETDDGVASAMGKLKRKNLDFIVLNSTAVKGAGFGTDTNQISIFDSDGKAHKFELKSKTEVAHDIVQHLLNHLTT
ncbi:MAG: bifunctional phosphopantothenoylcysteine decarboxylase/phosphopantothenate--cysteine ligase CoaBC [Bacteroidetes bacterium]|jgi:phosphopantothenoylcysteine decarboxylase / phosphopantothenate---cysteine ligase|nr:bifunctional phosphopantothenoylcysteine decarboxylase/phosphopantothenate--cysteine ligase CoaBC [Bacteroidota bacterium]